MVLTVFLVLLVNQVNLVQPELKEAMVSPVLLVLKDCKV